MSSLMSPSNPHVQPNSIESPLVDHRQQGQGRQECQGRPFGTRSHALAGGDSLRSSHAGAYDVNRAYPSHFLPPFDRQITSASPRIITHPPDATALSRPLVWETSPAALRRQEQPFSGEEAAHGQASSALSHLRHTMRYPHDGLPVLSAEQFHDGLATKGTRALTDRKMAAPSSMTDKGSISHDGPQTKKRGRKPSTQEGDEIEEETKRSRGRPRLDTTDQTAAERRRTQIRLAQRAYRNRKETAIVDLEAKVKGLKEVNQEMRNAYQQLWDFAASHDIMAKAPEVARQMQEFRALLHQRSNEMNSPTDGDDPTDRDSGDITQDDSRRRIGNPVMAQEESAPLPKHNAPQQLCGGLIVTHEVVAKQADIGRRLEFDGLNDEYEIIAAPTSENASFAPSMAFDSGFMNMPSSWTASPWGTLPSAQTYSMGELTFSRRLHRFTVEQACHILSMPDPPPKKIHQAFGFVKRFETLEEIRTRVRRILTQMVNEPLNDWRQPFHHVGGAGTHFRKEGKASPYPDGPTFPSEGYGPGPFNELQMCVRNNNPGESNYISWSPGWEGHWYDPYDVELYLAQNGIIIPASADVHTVEVQPGPLLEELLKMQPRAGAPTESVSLAATPANPNNVGIHTGMPPPAIGAYASAGLAISSSENVPISSPAPTEGLAIATAAPVYLGTPHSAAGTAHSTFASAHSGGFSNASRQPFPSTPSEPVDHLKGSKKVALNVEQFLNIMSEEATCMGRTPAFKPESIVTAFCKAASVASN
ncbi:hypothetical protein F5Y15DRAFT_385410 [Xylariaceae sp. FL0016]|nr:hypothetical protein F5Y15DRAFT_385410 [Xylariaceae sp. FL0016]